MCSPETRRYWFTMMVAMITIKRETRPWLGLRNADLWPKGLLTASSVRSLGNRSVCRQRMAKRDFGSSSMSETELTSTYGVGKKKALTSTLMRLSRLSLKSKGNYWEKVVYAESALVDLERGDGSVVFAWLHEHLPVLGTKIDWSRAQGRHSHWKVDNDEHLASMTIAEICQRVHADSAVDHVGDGLSPFGVRFDGLNAGSVAGALLEIPEHHYFVAADRSWIVVVTTEGDLDVLDR